MNNSNDSHVARVPPEILSLIFIDCLQLALVRFRYIHYHQRLVPLYLASVSRFWRQVACTTPELWTTCWLSYLHPELNSVWISRSGTRLFDIDGSLVPSDRIRHTGPLLSLITPHMRRCRSFSIDSFFLSKKFLAVCDFHAPELVSCQISHGNTPPWFHRLLNQAARLQRLEIWEFSPISKAALTNLTHLRIERLNHSKHLRTILATATKLRILDLGITFVPPFHRPYNSITHNTLFQLDLRIEVIVDSHDLFDNLALPQLNILKLGGCEGINAADGPGLHDFLQRSQCSLQKLSICRPEPDSLISLLEHQAVSSTETLECIYLDVTPLLLDFLCDTSNLPYLRKLLIEDAWTSHDLDFNLLGAMVSARRAPVGGYERPNGSRLEHLKLLFEPDLIHSNIHLVKPYNLQVNYVKAIAKSSWKDANPFTVEIEYQGFEDGESLHSDEDRLNNFNEDLGYTILPYLVTTTASKLSVPQGFVRSKA